jgi:hypothetical protein
LRGEGCEGCTRDVENNFLQEFVYVGVGAAVSFSGVGSMVKKLGERVLKVLGAIGKVPAFTTPGPFNDFMTTTEVSPKVGHTDRP